MGLNYTELTLDIRNLMLDELDRDVAANKLLESAWFTDVGRADWENLIKTAIQTGNDDSLAAELRLAGRLKIRAERRKPTGGLTTYRLPPQAADIIAEGEFNRYYVRAICRQVIKEGCLKIQVYRAKEVAVPRPESEQKIGNTFDASVVLDDLRSSIGLEPALGIPSGPASGLSVQRANSE